MTRTHEEFFCEIPVGRTVARHWLKADKAALDSAAAKLSTHRANPWVFSGDARHLVQFAGAEDEAALRDLTTQELQALFCWYSLDAWRYVVEGLDLMDIYTYDHEDNSWTGRCRKCGTWHKVYGVGEDDTPDLDEFDCCATNDF